MFNFCNSRWKIKQFVSEEEATISETAMGEGTTFDRIVIFKGDKYPKAINSKEQNHLHFVKTLKIYDEMAKFLEDLS